LNGRRDFFICYARKDRDKYARRLERALWRHGFSVWIDQGEIAPGESIIEKVEQGIKISRYVIPLITQNFHAREFPKREMRAALTREIGYRRDIVVPIYDILISTFHERYPLLSDKYLLCWKDGLLTIMEGLRRKLQTDRTIYESYVSHIDEIAVMSSLKIERLEYGYGSQIVEIPGLSLLKLPARVHMPGPAPAGSAFKRHRVALVLPKRQLIGLWQNQNVLESV
jgi:hypothetical protein